MTVNEIYNTWNKQWENGPHRTHGKFQFPEIVYQVREEKREWNIDEINVFSSFLEQTDKKWFVANFFSLQPSIPEQLLEPFIDAAINEPDPSSNEKYITPCLRVFGYETVFELLNQRFQDGNNQTKIGICKAFYWARSPLVKIKKSNGTWETKGYWLKWNGNYYGDYDWDTGTYFEMSESEVSECITITNKLLIKRRRLLIEEFLTNKNVDVRYQIKLALPDKLDSFSLENTELVKSYFEELKKDFVPDNYSDLQLKKRLGIFGNSRLFRFFMNKKNEENKRKGLLPLKNK